MKIDIYNHIFPTTFFDNYIAAGHGGKDIGKRVSNIQTIIDVDARLRILDEFDDLVQVITLPVPPIENIAGPELSPKLARDGNDGLARKILHQLNLLVAEGPDLLTIDVHRANQLVVLKHRNNNQRPNATKFDASYRQRIAIKICWVRLQVCNVYGLARCNDAADCVVWTGSRRLATPMFF